MDLVDAIATITLADVNAVRRYFDRGLASVCVVKTK